MHIAGDLIQLALRGQFDVIAHGCNCQCVMGAGIAKLIKAQLPEAYRADCATPRGSRAKLGTYSSAEIVRPGVQFTVVNAYTQFDWRGSGVKADYEAIRSVMRLIARDFPGARIGYPLIGAGHAGGDWDKIEAIIGKELSGLDHTLVRYAPT